MRDGNKDELTMLTFTQLSKTEYSDQKKHDGDGVGISVGVGVSVGGAHPYLDWKDGDESGRRGEKKGKRKSAPMSFGYFRNIRIPT